MQRMVERGGLQIAAELAEFIEWEALPGTGIEADRFWSGMHRLFADFTAENAALLAQRDEYQLLLDNWHDTHSGEPSDQEEYMRFLRSVGYIEEEPEAFAIDPKGVDDEIGSLAAPQLVVPALNPRFLLNAANARWGSLYDALYGTDALGTPPQAGPYDTVREARVIAEGRHFLDQVVPLAEGSWSDFAGFEPVLKDPSQLVGRRKSNLLFRHHGLHIELVRDPSGPPGSDDPAGITDIELEAALTTIVDFEDSVAAVDAADKVAAYRNWLDLIRGDLSAQFKKAGTKVVRKIARDRIYKGSGGDVFALPGRSILFARNVGLLMTTPAVRLPDGRECYEGILDAIVTSLIGRHDVLGLGRYRNSRFGSIYIVKPKLHGPKEAEFTNRLFDAVEDILALPRHTLKIGLMDEERRTSVNLASCIRALKSRIVFINTGFLDRTADEIHSLMRAGPVVPKDEMKTEPWFKAYEERNVAIGLACGFSGRAQIGKGMWAAPDQMRAMLDAKRSHPEGGANTSWVPSPTAATLHALHYHEVNVFARREKLAEEPIPSLTLLITPPLARGRSFTTEEIRGEMENNLHGVLGYLSRWIDNGIGCSTVLDIHDVGQMEDRATIRISVQHLRNWLLHGIITSADVDAALLRMIRRVDLQNSGEPRYHSMLGNPESLPVMATIAMIFDKPDRPNGYTEPLLHPFRLRAKERERARAHAGKQYNTSLVPQ